ncbi:ABC transporter ATP-binding protein [Actinomadura madurae]|uniref:ABC transporter ATP-binding protein n=1 Tax=Actinomadura madurae TaxID=1993 RepID=UPI0020271993|nr:ATP-binding cassette domain-containing protein [Actinomadura madurae]MCP9947568.1 ATP-binding cassette domain-containing protein [Actinomadura madurae]MCQ0011697.1 ATP-binding cassette domain-containing protein [Actinomadura madurae]URN03960.1 ATP-binding cassette domain-containing protein [Actinomadura madurae]
MIEARGLARTFTAGHGTVEAVRGVDLSVAAGEIVGFLGPNGAGKTTTLRMLTTLLAPTAGTARVAGRDLRADPAGVRRRIGYVAQGGGTDPAVPVAEELDLQARLHGVAGRRARIAELCARLDLDGLAARPAGSLSGGQRRRLDVALGLVHRPPLLFLDEPTAGLDPPSRGDLWDHVRSLRDRDGTTVFLTTHYLDEADALCDRLLIIDRGRIVAEGTPAALKRRVAGDVVTLALADASAAGAARAALSALPEVREAAVAGGAVRLTVQDGEKALMPLMRALDGAGVDLESLSLARPTLDDVFLAVTGRSLRDAA